MDVVFFIDLRKAFDTVNHKILLSKLEHYGVRDVMLDWFESYLSKCKQYVSVNRQSSEHVRYYLWGCPRFCPRTITIFNDLPTIGKVLNFYLFAEDTNIYYEFEVITKFGNSNQQGIEKTLFVA